MSEKKPAPQKGKTLTYHGKPLVRCGNTIYYGLAEEKFMVKLEVLESKPADDMEVANRVAVNLVSFDNNGNQRIIKHGEKAGVFDALDIGGVWLERTLAEQKAKAPKQ